MPDTTSADRRPLKSRNTAWAAALSGWLVRSGVRPNVISVASVGFSAIAGLALLATFWSCTTPGTIALLVVAAAGIQLRLLCNLMDGLVAVEGGMGGPLGNVYNDLPDRFADVFILLGAGFAARTWKLGVLDGATLGWLSALAAVLTAYVRVLGAQAGAQQHFLGPMAKPHRMALLTLACLLAAGERLVGWPPRVLAAALGIVVLGCAVTIVRRLRRIAGDLRAPRRGRTAMSPAEPAPKAAAERPHRLSGPLVGAVRLICGAGARWVEEPGVPAGRQRIFFANHTSHLDPVVIWSALPAAWRAVTRPVAARDYWQKGALRRFLALRVFNAVLITRAAAAEGPGEKIAEARHVIDQTLAEMGSRFSLILFPEGTRGAAEEPARFKSGLYHLAKARPEIELVPVYLENLGRILPKGEFLPVPLLATATFGRALHLGADEAREAFLERTRAAVVALRQEQMR